MPVGPYRRQLLGAFGNRNVIINPYRYGESVDLSSGLVLWWKCDEGTGTTMADSSTFSHDGAGPASWTTGSIYSNAYRGTTGTTEIVVSNTSDLNITGTAITASVHARFTASQTNACIFAKWGGTSQAWSIVVDPSSANKIRMAIRTSISTNKQALTSSTYNDGNWYRIIGWYDGSNVHVSVYDSGVLQESVTGDAHSANILSTSSVEVTGTVYGNRAGDFQGDVEDFRLWNRALSASERQALADVSP